MTSRRIIAMQCQGGGYPASLADRHRRAKQQEIWNLEEQPWRMAAAEDLSWIADPPAPVPGGFTAPV
jgi:hypothetical protein